jgi:hypothetical protein
MTAQQLHYDTHLHLFILFSMALAFLALTFLTWRNRKFHEIALLAASGFLAFSSVRHIPVFILLSIPYLPVMIRDRFHGREETFLRRKPVSMFFLLLVLLLCARVATNAYYISDRRVDRMGLGLGAECLPLGATRFLRENRLDGRILNSLDCGGWLDWQAPQPSFIDGRLEVIADDFSRDYTNSFKPGGLLPLLARYQPQLVMLDYNTSGPWADQLRDSPDWRLIYLDTCAALFAAKGYAPQLQPVDFPGLPNTLGISMSPDDETYAVVVQVSPAPLGTWLSGFYRTQTYPLGLSSLGLFSMKYGQYWVARSLFLKCLQEAGGGYEEIYFNLGIANLHLGNFSLGRLCLQDTLQLDPANPEALRMLKHFSQ